MFHFFATKVLGLAREESGHRFGSFSMERVPDDLWRIVFAFAGPAAGVRQVAARARTLDEFVEYRLATATDHSWNLATGTGTISSGPRRFTGGTRGAVMIGGTSCSSRRLPRMPSSSRAARAARTCF